MTTDPPGAGLTVFDCAHNGGIEATKHMVSSIGQRRVFFTTSGLRQRCTSR